MSMQFPGPINRLRACPSCGSRRLVVALYGLQQDPLGGEPYLECEGCCSVVRELSMTECRSLNDTLEGQVIIARQFSR